MRQRRRPLGEVRASAGPMVCTQREGSVRMVVLVMRRAYSARAALLGAARETRARRGDLAERISPRAAHPLVGSSRDVGNGGARTIAPTGSRENAHVRRAVAAERAFDW